MIRWLKLKACHLCPVGNSFKAKLPFGLDIQTKGHVCTLDRSSEPQEPNIYVSGIVTPKSFLEKLDVLDSQQVKFRAHLSFLDVITNTHRFYKINVNQGDSTAVIGLYNHMLNTTTLKY